MEHNSSAPVKTSEALSPTVVTAVSKTDWQTEPQAALSLGSSIHHRYEIRKQLSTSAGRRTLLAFDRQRQQLVLLKLLLFDQEFRRCDLRLFEQEPCYSSPKNQSYPALN